MNIIKDGCFLSEEAPARSKRRMAEVHLIGDIDGGDGFDSGDLFCKWGLSYGSAWRVLEGLEKGQTQVDHPQVGGDTQGVGGN